jgi:hypothetical protein
MNSLFLNKNVILTGYYSLLVISLPILVVGSPIEYVFSNGSLHYVNSGIHIINELSKKVDLLCDLDDNG